MNAVRQWWAGSEIGAYYRAQSPRDQLILLGVAVLLLLALFIVLIWRPAHDWRTANERKLEQATELLQFMRANRVRVQSKSAAGGAQNLLGIVGDAAREQQLRLSRFQPESEGSVTVVMDDEEFDRLISFVDVLGREHQLTLRQVSIDRKAPGRVSARLVIQ